MFSTSSPARARGTTPSPERPREEVSPGSPESPATPPANVGASALAHLPARRSHRPYEPSVDERLQSYAAEGCDPVLSEFLREGPRWEAVARVDRCRYLASLIPPPDRIELRLCFLGLDEVPPFEADGPLKQHLKCLDLRGNRLRAVPELGELKALREVDLSYNALTTVPRAIATLPRTLTIHLEANPLNVETVEWLRARHEDTGPRICF